VNCYWRKTLRTAHRLSNASAPRSKSQASSVQNRVEVRATTSLARFLPDTNRRDEARAMLAEIYGWFTEGFDTADMKDAKTLL
jgi:predicted ATPase